MVVVAGGSGTRMGAEIPKQFLLLKGRPILMHTLQRMHDRDATMELVLVLSSSETEHWKHLCKQHRFAVPHKIAKGGETRTASVKNGVQLTDPSAELIGVHDGVRPFVNGKVLRDCFQTAEETGAAVPATPVVQSLRKLDGDRNKAVDRDHFRAVQTPQCFQAKLLREAFANAPHQHFSDDASLVEASGHAITLVEGDSENIKITTPTDLIWAEAFLK